MPNINRNSIECLKISSHSIECLNFFLAIFNKLPENYSNTLNKRNSQCCPIHYIILNVYKKDCKKMIIPSFMIKPMDFPHCSDCLQLANIALGHLTTIYSRLNGVNNCCEMTESIIS